MPSAHQSFKYLYGNAFRAPNVYELNDFYFGDGVSDAAAGIDRHARTRVGALHRRLAAHVGLGLLVQGRRADHADGDRRPGGFLGVTYVNQGEVRAKGLELEAQMRLWRGAEGT